MAGARSASIHCADLDGDGRADVVTTGKPGVAAQVFLQRDGVLVEQGSYPANGLMVGSLDIGDVDGDGKPDLVFFAASPATALYAQLQTSAGQFAPAVPLGFPPDEFGDVTANRLTVSGQRNISASLSATRLVLSTSAGVQSLETSGAAGDIRVRDLNGDGRADIAVVHGGTLGVYYQNADGTFTPEQTLETYPTDSWTGAPLVAFGDFDSDGKVDVAVASQAALLLFFQE
ncbi:MAG TPA: VCBS repeat-containing protein [Burkholderiales bacterium]|nr:VCBS repeat-containing protein [Burkholderiales bacterium]